MIKKSVFIVGVQLPESKQLYKCHACGKQFVGGERLDPELIWGEYQKGKQTLL